MEDKIAGHKIPKYQVPEEDANKTRALAGLCNSCRLRDCLCSEGQR